MKPPPRRTPGADTPAALLSPAELLRLGSLDFVARLVVEGFLAGRHRSPGRGGSLEFAEHRAYVPGDDLRRIDWKVFGRSDRFYVRESEEETNLRAMLVLDVSASMAWRGEGPVSKLDYARIVGAALGHLLLGQQDAVGLAAIADSLILYHPPRGGPGQRARLMEALSALEAAGETHPEEPFRELADRLPRRGVLLLISDLLGPTERFLPGLRYFRHRKHEVVVLHVLDPAERTLAGLEGAPSVVDAETGRMLRAPAELAGGYRKALEELEAAYRRQAHDRGFDYVPLSTDEPVGRALGRYLEGRRSHPAGAPGLRL